MELIRTLKEKNNTKRLANIRKLAQEVISLSDFDNEIFIAYNGTPLIPVNKEWTTKEIMEELNKIRQNYINSKMKLLC